MFIRVFFLASHCDVFSTASLEFQVLYIVWGITVTLALVMELLPFNKSLFTEVLIFTLYGRTLFVLLLVKFAGQNPHRISVATNNPIFFGVSCSFPRFIRYFFFLFWVFAWINLLGCGALAALQLSSTPSSQNLRFKCIICLGLLVLLSGVIDLSISLQSVASSWNWCNIFGTYRSFILLQIGISNIPLR